MKELLYPPVLHWEVTPECNHNCIHCYNYWRKEPEKKNESIKDHLAIAKKIVERHPVSVVVTGGEPLIVFEAIKASLRLLRDNGISISINTNAVLVTEEIAEFMAKLKISAFVSLPCCEPSICDGITNVTNSLPKISKGIKLLLDAGVRVSVNMVVSKRNIDYIYETAKFAKEELGLESFFASRVSKPINSDTEFCKELLSREDVQKLQRDLLRIAKDFNMRVATAGPMPVCSLTEDETFQKFAFTRNCTAGKISYSIDYSGNIKACARDVQIYGNILTDNFSDVWSRMKDWRDETFLPAECKECNVKQSCKGGCRLDAFPHTGTRNALDPMADVGNIPIKFVKKMDSKQMNMEQTFIVPKTIQFIQEGFGWRVNVGSKFMYITDELKQHLSNCTQFGINEFMQKFDVDYQTTNDLMNLLVDNRIIFMRKE